MNKCIEYCIIYLPITSGVGASDACWLAGDALERDWREQEHNNNP
jgi:hypothetical protein